MLQQKHCLQNVFSILGPETDVDAIIEENEDGIFTVNYVPLEIGLFDIKIMWNNKEIPSK